MQNFWINSQCWYLHGNTRACVCQISCIHKMDIIVHCQLHFASGYCARCLSILLYWNILQKVAVKYWTQSYCYHRMKHEEYIIRLIVMIVRWVFTSLVCIELFYLFLFVCYCESIVSVFAYWKYETWDIVGNLCLDEWFPFTLRSRVWNCMVIKSHGRYSDKYLCSLASILMLSYPLYLCLLCHLFPSCYLTETQQAFIFPFIHVSFSGFSLFLIIIHCNLLIIKLLIM